MRWLWMILLTIACTSTGTSNGVTVDCLPSQRKMCSNERGLPACTCVDNPQLAPTVPPRTQDPTTPGQGVGETP